MKEREKKKKNPKEEAVIWTEQDPEIPSDVLGSYTGTPLNGSDPYEKPIQDADDL